MKEMAGVPPHRRPGDCCCQFQRQEEAPVSMYVDDEHDVRTSVTG